MDIVDSTDASRPHQSKGMRKGKKKQFMEFRPDSACIPINKKNQKERENLGFEKSGEHEVRFTGEETGFFNDGAPIGDNDFYDVECSTRKTLRTAQGNNRIKGLG